MLGDYQRAYQQHLKVAGELAELTSLARERAVEAEDLRHGLAEIERLEPVDGEDIELHAEAERLSNADTLHTRGDDRARGADLRSVQLASYEAADALTLLGSARHALEGAAQHDPALGDLAARLERGVLPDLRHRGRAGLLRRLGRGRPGPAGGRAGAPGRADQAGPRLRVGAGTAGRRWRRGRPGRRTGRDGRALT